MTRFSQDALLVMVILTLVQNNEASAPFFLQAITSALGTIPFTAGPMTSGLVGAKLAVGTKLLYYLGFFGRRSKPRLSPVKASPNKPNFGLASGSQFPMGMQAVPFPYAFGAGGFPQQFGGFGQPNFLNQYQHGYDPAQLFQILAAQGIDPISAMQAMSFDGGAGSQGIPVSQFPSSSGISAGPGSPVIRGHGIKPNIQQKPEANAEPQRDESVGDSDGDVESFFTFLRDMDDNSCISRLMCDIGADPSFLGEFSENIYGIISKLDVQPSSGAFQYLSIMETGKRDGGCGQRYPKCDDSAYEVVKNVAPSVGMPQNMNSETFNQL